jgi:hypothetical protein
MPIPKAMVATTTVSRPARQSSSICERAAVAWPAWYAAARTPAATSREATLLAVSRLRK